QVEIKLGHQRVEYLRGRLPALSHFCSASICLTASTWRCTFADDRMSATFTLMRPLPLKSRLRQASACLARAARYQPRILLNTLIPRPPARSQAYNFRCDSGLSLSREVAEWAA